MAWNKFLRIPALLVIIITLVNFAACSYSFTGASVPGHLKTIAILTFNDKSGSGEFDLGQRLTTQIIQKFIDDNTLMVGDRSGADSMLEGNIISITDAPAVVSGGDKVSSRRITVTVKVSFKDRIKKKTVFERDFSAYSDYTVGSDITSVRKTAIDSAVKLISEDILLGVVSNW